ncbi:SpoIIE family protein phosphatase [Leptospira sp. GIMC2001]|uniref:SpoIIE family protein phosphatase n=1 Tax=Leptospira sp. GIMC2001 TaxID=1513297 RepID=UPI00234A9841|nr:SpoIIE family protein phosphatase [Leptospira sp. GIMC2001]WCL48765.1 SpoIIE family protein phosphatase [Leptospira sp. GIMC2001]
MLKLVVTNILVAGAYILAAKLGFFLAFLNTQVSPIWPPEGVGFVALALFGWTSIPGVFAGAFLANLINNPHLPTAFIIAIGNTASSCINLYILLRLTGTNYPLSNTRSLLHFFVFATIPGAVVSASLGVGSLFLFDFVPANAFWNVFFTWFAGEMQGFIIVAPFLYNIIKISRFKSFSLWKWMEGLVAMLIIGFIAWHVFSIPDPLIFLPIPIMVYLSVRFRDLGAVFGSVILSTIAVYHAIQGIGPFAEMSHRINSLNNTLIFLDIFIFSNIIMAYFLVVLLNERDERNEALMTIQIDANLDLEKKVHERTKIIEEQNQEFQYQIRMARSIQTSLLPESIPTLKNIKIGYKYFPMMDVGGDFLDIKYFPETQRLSLFICDVSGHGIAAALVATMMKMNLSRWYDNPKDLVWASNSMHEVVAKKLEKHFITATFANIDLKENELEIAIAGHNPLLIVHSNGTYTEINPKGTIIFSYFPPKCEVATYSMKKGDQIVFYTDGITEARNGKGEFYELDRLAKDVHSVRKKDPMKGCEEIVRKVIDFSGGEGLVQDDLTILITQV